MADVTINYEGNAIATMSASGTKTLLTEGKYCTDDIEVVYVSPGGGGSSNLYGSLTPAENALSITISALAGTTNDLFLIKATGSGVAALNNGARAFGMSFEDFSISNMCTFGISTNATGTSFQSTHRSTTNGDTEFNLNRTTGVVSTTNVQGSGYFIGGVTYDWWSWGY